MIPRQSRLLTFACIGAASVIGLAAGCGGRQDRVQTGSEFTEREIALFEDGIDLIDDPKGLEGRWREDWDNDLNDRIASSDVIAYGTVTTLRTDVDLDHRTSYRLVFALEQTLKGEPQQAEFSLLSRGGAPGFATVDRDRERILNRKLVVFLKYAAGAPPVLHFHLSPPSDIVLSRVQSYQERESPRIRVIEHTQE